LLKKLALLSALLLSLSPTRGAFGQSEAGRELYPIALYGREGYIDRTGRVVVEPRFDVAYYFSEGIGLFATATTKDVGGGEVKKIPDKWGLIDSTGKVIARPQFTSAACVFSEGLLCVGTDEGVGFVDKSGRFVIAPRFREAKDFSEGSAPVRFGEKWGYVGKKGELVILARFDDADGFSEGLALVRLGERYAFINRKGEVEIRPSADEAGDFREGLAWVAFAKPEDPVGTEGVRPSFGRLPRRKSKAGYIDKSGRVVIEAQFDGACDFSEGLACVEVGGKMGYIDLKGRIVIAPQFEIAQDFSEGLAVVTKDGYYGYTDKEGRVVIEPQFTWAGQFSGGLAHVMVGDKMGYVDQHGSYVWVPTK
jgi:WG containing repeat